MSVNNSYIKCRLGRHIFAPIVIHSCVTLVSHCFVICTLLHLPSQVYTCPVRHSSVTEPAPPDRNVWCVGTRFSLWPGEMLTLRCQWDCLALTSLSDAMFTIPRSSGPGRFGMSTLYSSVFPHRDKSQKQLQISYNQSTIVIRNLYSLRFTISSDTCIAILFLFQTLLLLKEYNNIACQHTICLTQPINGSQ